MIVGADIVRYLLSGSGLTLLVLAGAIWLRVRPGSAGARRLLIAVAVIFTLASTYALDYAVSRVLLIGLRPFAAADAPSGGRTAIVVLGSGSTTVADWEGHLLSVVDRNAAARVLEAARVFHMIRPDVVVSSGGLPHPDHVEEPSGETMRDALVRLGIPASQIVVETRSTTTHDEAIIVKPILASLGVTHVVLVTSEAHMRRSLGTFRAEGIVATPAIARSIGPVGSWSQWALPSDLGLFVASEIVHEVLGIGYYTIRGWYRW